MSETPHPNGKLIFNPAYLRHVITLLLVTFTFGGWFMHQRTEMIELREENQKIRAELKEWSEWRNGSTFSPEQGITTKVSKIEGKISNLYERINKIDHKP